MNYIKQLNEEIKKLFPLYEMAQKQGNDEFFVYYTLDNEYASHRPHVHVCVKIDNKKWHGAKFKNGQGLKTVGAVFLPYEQLKNKIEFTVDNIQFETINDNNITNSKYVQVICKWLNSTVTDDFGNTISNAIKCFNDYKLSNGDTCVYLKKLK